MVCGCGATGHNQVGCRCRSVGSGAIARSSVNWIRLKPLMGDFKLIKSFLRRDIGAGRRRRGSTSSTNDNTLSGIVSFALMLNRGTAMRHAYVFRALP